MGFGMTPHRPGPAEAPPFGCLFFCTRSVPPNFLRGIASFPARFTQERSSGGSVRVPSKQDLCQAFNISPKTVEKYAATGVIGHAHPRGGRYATYPPDSYERIRKMRELVHDRVRLVDLAQRPNWWLPPHQTS